jgi:ATP-dependent DNA ligase
MTFQNPEFDIVFAQLRKYLDLPNKTPSQIQELDALFRKAKGICRGAHITYDFIYQVYGIQLREWNTQSMVAEGADGAQAASGLGGGRKALEPKRAETDLCRPSGNTLFPSPILFHSLMSRHSNEEKERVWRVAWKWDGRRDAIDVSHGAILSSQENSTGEESV